MSFTASTMMLRSIIQENSDKVKANFEPGSADYRVNRTFDHSQDNHSLTFKYQENLKKLWEMTREHYKPKVETSPGPGAYDPPAGKPDRRAFTFGRDMRVFDKLAREHLRAAIKFKESEYVRSYAELQLQTTSPSRNHSVARMAESEWKPIRDSAKYSFP